MAAASSPTPASTGDPTTSLQGWTATLPAEFDRSSDHAANASTSSQAGLWSPTTFVHGQHGNALQSAFVRFELRSDVFPSLILTLSQDMFAYPGGLSDLSWAGNGSSDGSFDMNTQAMATATTQPHQWELSAPNNSILFNTMDPIELSLTQPGPSVDSMEAGFYESLMSLLESDPEAAQALSNSMFNAAESQYFNFPDDEPSQSQDPQGSQSVPASTSQADYMNMDSEFSITPTQYSVSEMMAAASSSSASYSLYVPPTGASNAATRRVGGTWNPPEALMESPAMTPSHLSSMGRIPSS